MSRLVRLSVLLLYVTAYVRKIYNFNAVIFFIKVIHKYYYKHDLWKLLQPFYHTVWDQ